MKGGGGKTTPTAPSGRLPGLLGSYSPPDGVYDEVLTRERKLRPVFGRLLEQTGFPGQEAFERRRGRVDRLVRESGLVYSALGDPADTTRPWRLDAMPLAFESTEWESLCQGLIQRAEVLDFILRDLYGEQTLLRDDLLPPELIHDHPDFYPPLTGFAPPGRWLTLYAADLARAPDGQWWIFADRSDAPVGLGYTLENRLAMSQAFSGAFREGRVERLAGFFRILQQSVYSAAGVATGGSIPASGSSFRGVLWGPGTNHPNHFEDSYLARYLGFDLVQAGDMVVRDRRVMLKTLGGLLPVDAVLRRVLERESDPLAINGISDGVPGLIESLRTARVGMISPLGSGLLESQILNPFLPSVCEHALREELKLPSIATWWCGEAKERKHVRENLEKLAIRPAFRRDHRLDFPYDPAEGFPIDIARRLLDEQPHRIVGQERVDRGTAPIVDGDRLVAARMALRVFVVAGPDGAYQVLPGGLARCALTSRELDAGILAGKVSKDVWVLSDRPVDPITLLPPVGERLSLRRSPGLIPSRAADNLFWLGRYCERAEGQARWLRAALARYTVEGIRPELKRLIAALSTVELLADVNPATLESELLAAIFDSTREHGLASTCYHVCETATRVRERLSMDAWHVVSTISRSVLAPSATERDASDGLAQLTNVLMQVSAIGGLASESMTRTQGWRFLEIGRRLERGLTAIRITQWLLSGPQEKVSRRERERQRDEGFGITAEPAVIEAALEVADSWMTYRSRYLHDLQLVPALDLLLTDTTNPRSLLFQLLAIDEHTSKLPHEADQPLASPARRAALSALQSVRLLDAPALSSPDLPKTLQYVALDLGNLSDELARQFLAPEVPVSRLGNGGT
jgi:uncharacterized circularly permuted ATP-grasp superfamily protein/uncharacterized alpha-E superfamily protein